MSKRRVHIIIVAEPGDGERLQRLLAALLTLSRRSRNANAQAAEPAGEGGYDADHA